MDWAPIVPSVPGALFLANWTLDPPVPAADRSTWTAEAKALRPHHSLTPDNCVASVALGSRCSVLRQDLEQVLATLLPFAADYWDVPGVDTTTLGPQIL